MSQSRPLVIVHGACMDGMGAAACAAMRREFEGEDEDDDYYYED